MNLPMLAPTGRNVIAVKPVRPNFDRPPLLEQAITVMFDRLGGFTLGDFGLFWDRIRDRFPHCEAQEPLDHKIEGDRFRPAEIKLRLLEGNTLPRCFFLSDNGSELVQLQPDRFSFNWRGAPGTPYPRSEATMARFRELFAVFVDFAKGRGLGEVRIVQCELVNVNIVAVSEFGNSFADAPTAFRVPQGAPVDFLTPESYIYNTQHLISGETGPIGRLYVTLSPVLRVEDNQEAYRLELAARGAPTGGGTGTDQFFDIARSALNAGFLAATTEWAHEFWGLKNG